MTLPAAPRRPPAASIAPDAARRPRGRLAAALLWLVALGWGASVFVRAQRELAADLVVSGPERVWGAPAAAPDGWLLDPRPGPIAVELRDRFRPGAAAPDTADPRAALAALGLAFEEGRGLGDGLRPRVVLAPAGPLLVVGHYGRDPVVFDPARGVVRLRADVIAADAPSLVLTDAHEAPW